MARKGDRPALERLVRALQDPWFRFCYSQLRNEEMARDAAQETALRFVRLVQNFRGDSSITTWSLGIALNVCREMRRKRLVTSAEVPEGASSENGPEELAGKTEAHAALHQAMTGLSERQQQVVTLRFFEERSTEETAKIMGCAAGTVKATLHQALRALKNRVGQLA
jgi:RNA polymerase sigma-70 factor, ECF subfamily